MAGPTPHRDGRHKLGLAREQGRNRFPAPGRRRCHCCAPGTSDARLASTCCRCQQPRRRTANRPPADRPGRWPTNVMGDPPGANSNPNWRNSNLGSGWRPLLGAAGHRPGIAFPRMARHLRQAADCLPDAAPSRRPTASAWPMNPSKRMFAAGTTQLGILPGWRQPMRWDIQPMDGFPIPAGAPVSAEPAPLQKPNPPVGSRTGWRPSSPRRGRSDRFGVHCACPCPRSGNTRARVRAFPSNS